MRVTFWMFLPLTLFGCSSAKIQIGGEEIPTGGPILTLGATLLDFGSVAAGMGGSAKVLDISNTGDETLQILGFSVDDPTAPFAITDVGDTDLDPGESTGVVLSFTPSDPGSFGANLLISSTDPAGVGEVVLVGESADGGVALSPASYDFGTLSLDCTATVDVAVTNVGGSSITVDAVRMDEANGELTVSSDALPFTLAAAESRFVNVSYTPTLQHVVFGTLSVETSSSTTPTVSGTYFGAAQASPTALDTFSTPDGVVDFVVFIDKSTSMQQDGYVSRFRSNMTSLFDALVDAGTDFQLALVTDDDGCVNGNVNYITQDTPRTQAMSTLSVMFDSTYYGGELAEQGLTALYEATNPDATGDAGCNRGLVRSDGGLTLLGISDEDEQSAGDPSSWVASFTALKSDPSRVHISAIGGDLPDGCENAAAAVTWSTVSQLTSGDLYSICADGEQWAENLTALAHKGAGLASSYALTSEPDVGSIAVTIDGQASFDWTYDSATRSVVFTSGAGLTWNQDIDIAYDIAQSCAG